MVGFDPNTSRSLSYYEHAISGAVSGAMTRFVCQPLDVVKIRLQLQLEPVKSNVHNAGKYHGLLQALQVIKNEETIFALWKGHVPAQLLSVTYGIAQFVAFEALTKAAWMHMSQESFANWKPTIHFVCGGFAGCIATGFSFPFDVIRTRLVAQGHHKAYNGVCHAFISIVGREGPLALYKGLLPTFLQIAPYSGLQFGFYTFFNMCMPIVKKPKQITGLISNIACGALAGVCAKAVIYPMDVTKKRLQVQGFICDRQSFGKMESYSGMIDCMFKTFRGEGLMGLYKGFGPSLVKAAVATGCNFAFYEQICMMFHTVQQ